MRWFLAITVVAALAVSGAAASNVINEHGPYTEGVHFTIDQVGENDVGVRIRQGSVWADIWKFEAYDNVTGNPGYINYILIDPWDDVGYIRLRIVGAPGHMYGAHDVKEIDLLANADNTTEIYSIFIDGDLGTTAAIEADNIGSVSAAGSLLHDISAADDITGTITIHGSLLAGIYADSIASVNVSGVATHTGNIYRRDTSTQTGNITINGSYGGDITMSGAVSGDISIDVNLTSNGDISIGSGLYGSIDIGDDLATGADISIGGGMGAASSISVGGDHAGSLTLTGALLGTIDVGQDVTAAGEVTMGSTAADSEVTVAGDLAGDITVNTSSWGSIIIEQDITADGLVSVDSLGGYYDSIRVWYNHAGQIIVEDIIGDEADIRLNTFGGVTSGLVSVGTTVGPEFGVSVLGDLTSSGEIAVGSNYGAVWVDGDVSGSISVTELRGFLLMGDVSSLAEISVGSVNPGLNPALISMGDLAAVLDIEGNVDGRIRTRDLYKPGRIVVGDDVSQADPNVPAIHIRGSIVGTAGGSPEDPMIEVVGELDGVIAIDGGLDNAIYGPEIQVGSLDTENLGAITIDYDGWDDAHDWDPNAVIMVDTAEYSENTPLARVYRISKCKGDLDNDRNLDSVDQDAMELTVPQYAADYPGLLESHDHHADVDNDLDVDEEDADALDWLIEEGCVYCMMAGQLEACNADIVEDGTVNLADLAMLLGHYGMTTGATRNDGDVQGNDGDVDLFDLAELLSYYGDLCGCFDASGGGGDGPSYVDVSVVAYDTKGYSGGGFEGEVDHFVFDLKIEVDDPNSDDWVVTGAVLRTYNDATFRLSTAATTPDQYATFVAAPWTTVPGSATASLAGGYDPPDPNEVFTTTDMNLAWFDGAESHDGPATVMRIVIDVSDVEGADVSAGFGSVYFGAKIGKDDIQVADLASDTFTAESAPSAESLSGNFWVKGE